MEQGRSFYKKEAGLNSPSLSWGTKKSVDNPDNKTKAPIFISGRQEVKTEAIIEDGNAWLSQEQIALIYGKSRSTINEHLSSTIKEYNLNPKTICRIFRKVGNTGRYYEVKYYNLFLVMLLGFRVGSQNSLDFKRWAALILKDYVIKGYVGKNK